MTAMKWPALRAVSAIRRQRNPGGLPLPGLRPWLSHRVRSVSSAVTRQTGSLMLSVTENMDRAGRVLLTVKGREPPSTSVKVMGPGAGPMPLTASSPGARAGDG